MMKMSFNYKHIMVKIPYCQICGEPILTETCYIMGPETEAFECCVCLPCMEIERAKMRKTNHYLIFEDWDETRIDRRKDTPIREEEIE